MTTTMRRWLQWQDDDDNDYDDMMTDDNDNDDNDKDGAFGRYEASGCFDSSLAILGVKWLFFGGWYPFLVATKRQYESVRPSVGRMVGLYVGP